MFGAVTVSVIATAILVGVISMAQCISVGVVATTWQTKKQNVCKVP